MALQLCHPSRSAVPPGHRTPSCPGRCGAASLRLCSPSPLCPLTGLGSAAALSQPLPPPAPARTQIKGSGFTLTLCCLCLAVGTQRGLRQRGRTSTTRVLGTQPPARPLCLHASSSGDRSHVLHGDSPFHEPPPSAQTKHCSQRAPHKELGPGARGTKGNPGQASSHLHCGQRQRPLCLFSQQAWPWPTASCGQQPCLHQPCLPPATLPTMPAASSLEPLRRAMLGLWYHPLVPRVCLASRQHPRWVERLTAVPGAGAAIHVPAPAPGSAGPSSSVPRGADAIYATAPVAPGPCLLAQHQPTPAVAFLMSQNRLGRLAGVLVQHGARQHWSLGEPVLTCSPAWSSLLHILRCQRFPGTRAPKRRRMHVLVPAVMEKRLGSACRCAGWGEGPALLGLPAGSYVQHSTPVLSCPAPSPRHLPVTSAFHHFSRCWDSIAHCSAASPAVGATLLCLYLYRGHRTCWPS